MRERDREQKAANSVFIVKLFFMVGNWRGILLGGSGSSCKTHTSEASHPQGPGAGVFIHELSPVKS